MKSHGGGKKDLKLVFLNPHWKKPLISILLSAAMVFAVVAFNMFANALPASLMQIDMTTTGIFTLSSDTKELIDSLDEDINIYWICAKGKENSRTKTILERYDEAGDKIFVEMIDPAYHPNFVSLHSQEESLTYNSLIVESSKRTQVIKYAEYNTSTYFLLEDYINSALRSVCAEKPPAIYTLEGHGEAELSPNLLSQIALNGYEVIGFNFLNAGSVPEDAEALLIIEPKNDISIEEGKEILKYLEQGGNLLLITGFSAVGQPNLDYVMENYGLMRIPGYICEGNNGSFYSTPTYVVPSVQKNPSIANVTEGIAYVLCPVAHGIAPLEMYRSSLNQFTILKSSDYSYAKQDLMSMDTAFAVGDISGPFDLGRAVTEETSAGTTRVIWYSASGMLEENVDSVVSGTNTMLFLNSLNFLAGKEVSTLHAKATATGTLTVMPQSKALWSAIMLGVVPGCTLALGSVICTRRRRR